MVLTCMKNDSEELLQLQLPTKLSWKTPQVHTMESLDAK